MKVSYRPIVSTNISLSNAIVLASRLSTTLDVFLFVLFAIEVNILLPLFDAKIRLLGLETIHWPIAFLTFNLTSYLMYILLNYKFWFTGFCLFCDGGHHAYIFLVLAEV